MTDDIFLTLSLLLSAALVARFLASVIPVPEILILVAVGALLGDSALDVIDVPLDSLGAQLLFTLGVSMILFYGGLNLSLPVLRRVWIGLGLLVVPGMVLTAVVVGRDGLPGLRPRLDRRAADGRGARSDRSGDPDPAVRALAAAAEGGADRGRRVRLQRPDRRRPGAGAGRRPAQRRRLAHAPRRGLPARPADQHGDRRDRRHRAGRGDLEPARGHLAGVVRRSRC